MAGDTETMSNGRVTTRELHKVQLEMIEQMSEMERRILAKLEPIPLTFKQASDNKEEIDRLRSRSNTIDGINAFLAILGATIAGIIGTRAP